MTTSTGIYKKKVGQIVFVRQQAQFQEGMSLTPQKGYRIACIGARQGQFVITDDKGKFHVFEINDARFQAEKP